MARSRRTLATMLGEEMVALADRLDPVTADEAGLATVTRWVGEFMDLHEQWAPVFRSFWSGASSATTLFIFSRTRRTSPTMGISACRFFPISTGSMSTWITRA